MFRRTVPGADYNRIISAIKEGGLPHYLLLHFSDKSWNITDLIAIPGHLFPLDAIVKRRSSRYSPETPKANILLREIARESFIPIVRNGVERTPDEVRDDFRRSIDLKETQPNASWRSRQLAFDLRIQFEPTTDPARVGGERRGRKRKSLTKDFSSELQMKLDIEI